MVGVETGAGGRADSSVRNGIRSGDWDQVQIGAGAEEARVARIPRLKSSRPRWRSTCRLAC